MIPPAERLNSPVVPLKEILPLRAVYLQHSNERARDVLKKLGSERVKNVFSSENITLFAVADTTAACGEL